jgi:hypothetical protein
MLMSLTLIFVDAHGRRRYSNDVIIVGIVPSPSIILFVQLPRNSCAGEVAALQGAAEEHCWR